METDVSCVLILIRGHYTGLMALFARADTKLWLWKKLKEKRFDSCVYLHLKVKSGPSGGRYSKKK